MHFKRDHMLVVLPILLMVLGGCDWDEKPPSLSTGDVTITGDCEGFEKEGRSELTYSEHGDFYYLVHGERYGFPAASLKREGKSRLISADESRRCSSLLFEHDLRAALFICYSEGVKDCVIHLNR